jgi:hypothetical protein
MTPRKLILALCASFALLATPASAQVAGPEDGVTAGEDRRGGHTIRFSREAAAVYRRIAGRRVDVGCTSLERQRGGYAVESGFTMTIRAPKRRGAIRTGARGGVDYCFVETRGRSRERVAIVPVTRFGRVYVDELRWTFAMTFVEFTREGETAPLPIDDVVAAHEGFAVALDAPDANPPAGRVGYWTDGTRAMLVAVSAEGRRLFIETEGDVVRTNVLVYLTAD